MVPAAGGQPVLLVFSSLVKAVAYMQGAGLAHQSEGVNKIGKFPAAVAQAWVLPLTLNPEFALVRDLPPGPAFEVDSQTAVRGDEYGRVCPKSAPQRGASRPRHDLA